MLFLYRKGVCLNNRQVQGHRQGGLRCIGGAGVVVFATGMVAYGQDTVPPGVMVTLDVTQRFEFSDNPDLDVDGSSDFFGRTLLGLGVQSVRKVDSFSFNLNGDIEEGRNNSDTLDLTNYGGQLEYIRDTRNARVAFNLGYQEADADQGAVDTEFDANGNVINQNDGSRQSLVAGFDSEFGREAPVGGSFSWRYNEINFSDTANLDLQDTTRNTFRGGLDFEITPRVTVGLTGEYADFDAGEGGVDRETTGLGLTADLVVSPVDNVSLSLGYEKIERSGAQSGTDEGVNGAIRWTRALTNGDLSVSYSSDVSSNNDGRRSFLNVSRDIELPRGALALTLGLTGADTLGTDPLIEANYTHRMPTSTLSLGLRQQVTSDNNNNEEINTRLNLSYNRELTKISGLQASLSLFNRNELQDNPNDGQRLDLSVTYRHDLTSDWGLVSGFTHRFSTEDSSEDRRSNTVFVGVQRNFSWVP